MLLARRLNATVLIELTVFVSPHFPRERLMADTEMKIHTGLKALHCAILRTIAHFTYSFFSVPFFISRDIEQAWM